MDISINGVHTSAASFFIPSHNHAHIDFRRIKNSRVPPNPTPWFENLFGLLAWGSNRPLRFWISLSSYWKLVGMLHFTGVWNMSFQWLMQISFFPPNLEFSIHVQVMGSFACTFFAVLLWDEVLLCSPRWLSNSLREQEFLTVLKKGSTCLCLSGAGMAGFWKLIFIY